MARRHGTDRNGNAFSEATKVAVWGKGTVVAGVDPRARRKDSCGAWIDWAAYGETTHHGHGWEIDHIRPAAKGGGDELGNLQPLQWQNNRHKGEDWPEWSCAVSAN